MTPEQQAAREAQKRSVEEFVRRPAFCPAAPDCPNALWPAGASPRCSGGDDIDTARRHLDLYESSAARPSTQTRLPLLVRQGNIDPKTQERLNGRVQQCWVIPTMLLHLRNN